MWPWEHLAAGYLAVSLLFRLVAARPPRHEEALLAALGTQFPDLVDKPLGWTFHVLPSGTSLAHSVFFAVPLTVAVLVVAARYGHGAAGVAFGVGYLLHLPADATYGLVYGYGVDFGVLLWPLVPTPPPSTAGFLDALWQYGRRHAAFVASERGLTYLAGELLLLGSAGTLWLADGHPGWRRPRWGWRE